MLQNRLSDWLYKKEIQSIDEMTNLSKKTRELLSADYEIGLSAPVNESKSSDGTKKYLYKVLNDKYIETAYIPDDDRATICVSSQAGCKMGCIFCMTGKQGFQGNLSSNEILNQFRSLPEFTNLTNMVYMGMGEPLDNITEVLKSLDILTKQLGICMEPDKDNSKYCRTNSRDKRISRKKPVSSCSKPSLSIRRGKKKANASSADQYC